MFADSLVNITIGKPAIIKKINAQKEILNRFADLGIVVGSEITPILRSYDNNLTAFLINGAVIALRKETADKIKVISQ